MGRGLYLAPRYTLPGPCSWLWVDGQEDKGEDGDSAWGLVQQWEKQELRDHRTLQCGGWCWGDMRRLGLEVRQP